MFLESSDEAELSANPLAGTIAVVCAVMLVWMLVRYQPLDQLTRSYGKIYLGGATPGANVQSASVAP
jgi:hypothetical protein